MLYKTYNIEGDEITPLDLQNKGAWCETGASYEQVFVSKYPQLDLIINPEKKTNIYAPDLLNKSTLALADLKTQNTPFFMAADKYGIDPQFAVTFNRKDYLRYTLKYPGIDIYFWVDWQAIKFLGKKEIVIKPMVGVWKISYANLLLAVEMAPLHSYAQRINDYAGNARDSYVLNINSEYFEKMI